MPSDPRPAWRPASRRRETGVPREQRRCDPTPQPGRRGFAGISSSPRPRAPVRKLRTPPPRRSGGEREQRGGGAAPCGAAGAGGGPAPVCADSGGEWRALQAEPPFLSQSGGRGDLLPRKGAGEESNDEPDKYRGGEGRPSRPPPRGRARLELPLLVRPPRAVPRPFRGAVQCAQAGRGAAATAEGEALALQLLFPRGKRRQREGDVVLCVQGKPIRDALTEGLLQDAPAFPPFLCRRG